MDSPSMFNHCMVSFYETCSRNPDKVALRPYDPETRSWSSITFSQCLASFKASAEYWKKTIDPQLVASSKVVAVWQTGLQCTDLISIFGLSLAGFIPQPFSKWHANPEVIYDLMKQSGASVIVCDSEMAPRVDPKRVHLLRIPDYNTLEGTESNILPPEVRRKDIAFIFCSSGTTSTTGSPKIIPVTCLWMKNLAYFKMLSICYQRALPGPGICTSLGSYAHVATVTGFLSTGHYGWTTVQTPSMDTADLLHAIKECNINVLFLYAGPVGDLLRLARTNPDVKKVLKGLHEICYVGWPLPTELENWAYDQQLPLVSFYGTTEAAPTMVTTYGGVNPEDRIYRILPGSGAYFIPFDTEPEGPKTNGTNRANGHNGINGSIGSNGTEVHKSQTLVEMVIPRDADDAPPDSLFSEDGLHHLKDLFIEVYPGRYQYRGRFGDFIRMDYNGGLCDAKSLEDQVRKLSGDAIYDCVVVGSYKPTPTLIVELTEEKFADESFKAEYPNEMVKKLAEHNARAFPWERVVDARKFIIVEQSVLPRTEKGNIKRAATEKIYEHEIEAVYLDKLAAKLST